MIADLYIGVSTDEQADQSYPQRHQEDILRKYCKFNYIEIRRVLFEDHSVKTFNRPVWKRYLLFTKWDRFSRNTDDAYQMISTLRSLGIEPQAIVQPLDPSIPENIMMLAFYLAISEVGNDRRALNVMDGMHRARKEGRWTEISIPNRFGAWPKSGASLRKRPTSGKLSATQSTAEYDGCQFRRTHLNRIIATVFSPDAAYREEKSGQNGAFSILSAKEVPSRFELL